MSSSFHHEKRRTFNERERAEFFSACGGKCADCNRKIPFGMEWDLDHRIPLADGGTNDDSNLQVLCEFCHSAKTTDDVGQISKGKRMFIKASVPRRYRQKRGFR